VNNRLRELRAARRWSQADLADRLDVSRQTINAIETSRYDPSLPLAFKLAALFGLPIESLFWPGGEGPGEGLTVQPDGTADAGPGRRAATP
jgi:putative transcriptional regulator